jgi:hypothetical protein
MSATGRPCEKRSNSLRSLRGGGMKAALVARLTGCSTPIDWCAAFPTSFAGPFGSTLGTAATCTAKFVP